MNFMYRKNECKLLLINSLHALIPLTFFGKGQGMFYTLFKIFINNTKEKKFYSPKKYSITHLLNLICSIVWLSKSRSYE